MGVKTAVRNIVKNALTDEDRVDELVFVAQSLPFLIVSIPDEDLVDVISALMDHPLVDYIEAVKQRPIELLGDVSMAVPALFQAGQILDSKHTLHRVDQAWTQAGTKGSGIIVAVLDHGTIPNHSDGTANQQMFGYIGSPGSCFPFYPTPVCENRAEEVHGPITAGFIGMDDDSDGGVGIAPDATLYTMKTSNLDYGDTSPNIHEDAVMEAVDHAVTIGVDIISMSWIASMGTGSNVYNSMLAARQTYDIFMVSGIKNPENSCSWPFHSSPIPMIGGLFMVLGPLIVPATFVNTAVSLPRMPSYRHMDMAIASVLSVRVRSSPRIAQSHRAAQTIPLSRLLKPRGPRRL